MARDKPKEIRISLLGHKDHGKSTLIGRILQDTNSITKDRIEEARGICRSLGKEFELAFLLDSFVEEREGGFTLDTTLAQARHKNVIYSLIDVPGHKELVRNMLSGASMADAAILIVSAQKGEGLADETRLHAYLARLLGINRLIVAISKMDASGYSETAFNSTVSGIRSLLGAFGYSPEDIAFVPLSAKEGDNVLHRSAAMGWYGGMCLMEHIERIARDAGGTRMADLPGRMAVQDVYGVLGERVVVGRIECGKFSKGERIEIGPSMAMARIAKIQSAGGKDIGSASAGQNVGLTLDTETGISRGAVIMEEPRKATPRTSIRAKVFCLPQARMQLGQGMEIVCGPQESGCVISAISGLFHPIRDGAPRMGPGFRGIGPSESGEAELSLMKPMILEPFDRMPPLGRFVLLQKGKVAGVGVVL